MHSYQDSSFNGERKREWKKQKSGGKKDYWLESCFGDCRYTRSPSCLKVLSPFRTVSPKMKSLSQKVIWKMIAPQLSTISGCGFLWGPLHYNRLAAAAQGGLFMVSWLLPSYLQVSIKVSKEKPTRNKGRKLSTQNQSQCINMVVIYVTSITSIWCLIALIRLSIIVMHACHLLLHQFDLEWIIYKKWAIFSVDHQN